MRRPRCTALLVLSASLVASTAVGASASTRPVRAAAASNWTMGGYNAAQTAYNANERSLTTATVGKLKSTWHRSALNTAVVQGSSLWAATDGGIDRVSLASGKVVHKYKLGSPYGVPMDPVVGPAHVIADAQGVLSSVSISSGKRAWKISHPNTGNVGHWWSNKVLSGSQLFAIYTTYTSSTSTYTYTLEAINASTGKLEWHRAVTYGPMAVGGGRVYATVRGQQRGPNAYDQVVVALNAKTGKQAWSHQFAELQTVTGYAVSSGRVIATAGGSIYGSDIYSLSATNGAVQWANWDTAAKGSMRVAPAGADPMITSTQAFYLSSNSHLVALNLTTGKVQWRAGYLGHNNRALVGAAGVAYSVNPKGQVTGYRMSNGAALFHSKAGNYQPELVAGGRLVAISYGGDADETTTITYARQAK